MNKTNKNEKGLKAIRLIHFFLQTYWKESVRHGTSWHAVSWRHLAQRARYRTGILHVGP